MSDPWFKFYPSDWLSGTRGLTPAETGVYITLIAMMYENDGSLKRDDSRLSRRCGCTKASFTKILANLIDDRKFYVVDGSLSNERVNNELSCRVEKSQKRSDAANKKWASHKGKSEQNQSENNASASKKTCKSDANTRSHISDKINNKKIDEDEENKIDAIDPEFRELMNLYPKKGGDVSKALSLYRNFMRHGVPHGLMIFAVHELIRTLPREKFDPEYKVQLKYKPLFPNWLNELQFEPSRDAYERAEARKRDQAN